MQADQNPQDPDQARFREWFSEVRREDRAAAPPFQQSWQAALDRTQGTAPPAFHSWRAAAAIVLLITLGVVAAFLRPAHRNAVVVTDPPQRPASRTSPAASIVGTSIVDWRSPTEFLLELAADETSPFGADGSLRLMTSNKRL
jgi:hypothetical protein